MEFQKQKQSNNIHFNHQQLNKQQYMGCEKIKQSSKRSNNSPESYQNFNSSDEKYNIISSYSNANNIDEYVPCHLIYTSPEYQKNNLFLGDVSSALDLQFIERDNIKTVITAGACLDQVSFKNNKNQINHIVYEILDHKNQNLIKFFDEFYYLIERSFVKGSILVHCAAGISRSSTMVISYLMKKKLLTFKQAISLVREKRPSVLPNLGFQRQLKKYQAIIFGQEHRKLKSKTSQSSKHHKYDQTPKFQSNLNKFNSVRHNKINFGNSIFLKQNEEEINSLTIKTNQLKSSINKIHIFEDLKLPYNNFVDNNLKSSENLHDLRANYKMKLNNIFVNSFNIKNKAFQSHLNYKNKDSFILPKYNQRINQNNLLKIKISRKKLYEKDKLMIDSRKQQLNYLQKEDISTIKSTSLVLSSAKFEKQFNQFSQNSHILSRQKYRNSKNIRSSNNDYKLELNNINNQNIFYSKSYQKKEKMHHNNSNTFQKNNQCNYIDNFLKINKKQLASYCQDIQPNQQNSLFSKSQDIQNQGFFGQRIKILNEKVAKSHFNSNSISDMPNYLSQEIQQKQIQIKYNTKRNKKETIQEIKINETKDQGKVKRHLTDRRRKPY